MNIPMPAQAFSNYTPVSDRAKVFSNVSRSIPLNDYGLPKFIFRPDLIPENFEELPDEDQYTVRDSAAIGINYDEGFPTTDDGQSLWSQMFFEPVQAFDLFKRYLDLGPLFGARRLEDLSLQSQENNEGPAPLDRNTITEIFHFYSWAVRAKAFDLFRVAAHQKLRESRILTIQDQHYLMAEGLLGKVATYFEQTNDDGELVWMKELNPKVALDFLDKLSKIQRTSVGLSAHGHAQGEEYGAPRNASVEVMLRSISQSASDPNTAGGSTKADMRLLLEDPETAALAQELIIKVGSGN